VLSPGQWYPATLGEEKLVRAGLWADAIVAAKNEKSIKIME